MKTFLKPFAEEMVSLDQGIGSGVSWVHPVTKQFHRSTVKLLVTVFDAPARAMGQNVMHHNGRYGCNVCETKACLTPPVPGHKRLRRFEYIHTPTLRTKDRMYGQAVRVNLEGLDHAKGTSSLGPWCIKDRISDLDEFLKIFRHPSFVHRILRQLGSLKYWKASDFYYFMLFESLPCLKGHLPDIYFQHFTLLVLGIFKLLKTNVTELDISEADSLLRLFVMDFGRLDGPRSCTYSVHQLIHLGLCVRRFGPLHCWSAFVYEDLNGMVAKRTHGTNNVDAEIVRNIKICQGIHVLNNVAREHHGMNVLRDPLQSEILGKELCVKSPVDELLLLQDNEPTVYSRAKLGYDTFTSEMHKTLKSQNFHVMWMGNEQFQYGSIKYFARTQHGDYVVIRLLKVDHTQVFYHRETQKCAEHLVPVSDTQHQVVIKFVDIVKSIVKVGRIGRYLYKRPNLYRYVL
ncbi:hypothetical protein ONE63_011136 [Megalurothrips usitatus]|uniref:Transposase domain-containing protein n=1 Tax=Megalurothrips usitatus TaxID=439358 RepID=A0AAV7XF43_9NEOP|nr:hypothetical protein ONE63_011136 [Megalurothrips usitatus]